MFIALFTFSCYISLLPEKKDVISSFDMNITLFEDAYLQRIDSVKQPEEINLIVINALRFVMQNVFHKIANTFFITISSNERSAQFWLDDVMDKLFATYSFMAFQLIVLSGSTNKPDLPGKRYCNMIIIDSFKSLEKTAIADNNRNSDDLEFYFIFLQTKDDLTKNEMEKIFKYCFENFWIHCNVMVQNQKGEVLIYTYFPFKDQQCFQTKPELINEFKGDRFTNNVIFPDKLKNLHSCPLKLTTWIVPPFVINKTDNLLFDKLKTGHLSGFEMYILAGISRAMNFTLNIDVISINTYSKNQSPSSVPIRMLKNFETNITMGYFRRTAERDRVATASYVTYYLSLVAVILRKQNKYKSLSIYTFPFDTATWIIILLFCCLVIVLNNINIKRIRKNNFLIFEILFGMPIKNIPKNSSKRIYFMSTLLCTFFLRSVYQSLLFYLFHTHLYVSPPTTIGSLVAEGYKAVSTEMSMHFFGIIPPVEGKTLPIVILYTPNEMNSLYFLEVNRDINYAAISVLDFALYYGYEILPANDVLQVLPINVNDQQIGFYLTKHSYLVDHFNNYILLFQQSGLQRKYREWTYIKYRIPRQNDFQGATGPDFMINLGELLGFFIIVLLMFLLSFVVFVLELLSKRIKVLELILKQKEISA